MCFFCLVMEFTPIMSPPSRLPPSPPPKKKIKNVKTSFNNCNSEDDD